MQSISCSPYHAVQSIIESISCNPHHAVHIMHSISCSPYHAFYIMQSISCIPINHAVHNMKSNQTSSPCHAVHIMQSITWTPINHPVHIMHAVKSFNKWIIQFNHSTNTFIQQINLSIFHQFIEFINQYSFTLPTSPQLNCNHPSFVHSCPPPSSFTPCFLNLLSPTWSIFATGSGISVTWPTFWLG